MRINDSCKRLVLHLKSRRLSRSYRPAKRPGAISLALETLENRTCPSLLVGSFYSNSILSFDESTGSFNGALVSHHSGGLVSPRGMVMGTNGDLYVNSGKIFANPSQSSLLVYDAGTGNLVTSLLPQGNHNGQLTYGDARGLIFGPDGNIYVASDAENNILQIDPSTGTILQAFVPTGSGGINHPQGVVFGPDGNLYVADAGGNSVLRYEGPTSPDRLAPGTPLPSPGNTGAIFVPSSSGGLDHPASVVFGPDRNLYADSGLFSGVPSVLRFDGRTGAPLPSAGNAGATFVAPASGGLSTPHGIIFGPDNNLYVSNGFSITDKSLDGSVLRYDGKTGQFIDTFVQPGSGGFQGAHFLVFTESDPVTLVYRLSKTSVLTTISATSGALPGSTFATDIVAPLGAAQISSTVLPATNPATTSVHGQTPAALALDPTQRNNLSAAPRNAFLSFAKTPADLDELAIIRLNEFWSLM